jgi:hypothetical protein
MRTRRAYELPLEDQKKIMRDLCGGKWTTAPTKPGWFWARDGDNDEPFIALVATRSTDPFLDSPFEVIGYDDETYPVSNHKYWLGPLPVPQPPQESE